MQLSELVWSDLFVGPNINESWFRTSTDSLAREPIPEECGPELESLRNKLDSHTGTSTFRLKWQSSELLRLRIEKKQAAEDLTIYICRRFNMPPGPLATLGMPNAVASKLLSDEIRDGLVVFLGQTGSGKSTTAGCYIHDRLANHGGVCWTVESPCELQLQGQHGKGICYQTEVESDADIGPALASLYRSSPNIIFIGEVKDGAAAREAITASLGGHLVIVTFHANDLVTGIARLARMAEDESASVGLADALKVAMHLRLNNTPARPLPGESQTTQEGTGNPCRYLQVEPLWMEGELASGLRSIVRNSDFQLLRSEVDRQRRTLMTRALP